MTSTDWFFSPHADDAALSCGGQIAALASSQRRAVIVTVMAGDPPADMLSTPVIEAHWARWGIGQGRQVTAARRDEDKAAAQALGAEIQFMPFPDAIYRGYSSSPDAMFARPALKDLIGLLGALIGEVDSGAVGNIDSNDTAHLPLGVGSHVDHLIVGALGALLRRMCAVAYYEDYPYSRDRDLIERTVEERFEQKPAHVITHALDEAALAAKIGAIGCYTSQISTFWTDTDAMARAIREYTAAVGGEREWVLDASEKTT